MNLFEFVSDYHPPPKPPAADICARKHGGAETSVEANERVAPHKAKARAEVLAIIKAANGITLEEIAERLGKQVNAVSGRITELLKDGLIVVAGKTVNSGGSSCRLYRCRVS